MALKFLRKRKNMKFIMWCLAIFIIPAFVIWGTGSSNKRDDGRPDYAGKIFNKKISYEEYASAFQVVRDYAIETFGKNIPLELIDQMAWNRIILLQAAKRQNIIVKDSEIAQKIASFPVFQRNGRFDRKTYKSIVGEYAKNFEEKIRSDLSIAKIKEEITKTINLDDKEIKNSYVKKFEKVKASYIKIPYANFEKNVLYSDSELEEFYSKKKERFRKPDEINIKYIEIPFAESDKEKDAEEIAYKLMDSVVETKDLDKSAGIFSVETKETGFFNIQEKIPGIGWLYELSEIGFELNLQEIHNMPIKGDKGFYIIQLKEQKKSYIPEFEEAKENVKQSYLKEKSIELAYGEAKKIYEKLHKGLGDGLKIEDMSKDTNMELKNTDFVTRENYIPEIGPAKNIIEACLELKKGEIAKPVKMQTAWIIPRFDEYQDIDEDKFLEEKKDFGEAILARKKQEVFEEWFEKLKKEADFVSYTSSK